MVPDPQNRWMWWKGRDRAVKPFAAKSTSLVDKLFSIKQRKGLKRRTQKRVGTYLSGDCNLI